ncbi:MAG: hypothetical protein J0M24_05015 [Verrucomicrobia bacterium]|nr:hypothetical protein [Verrucomicrobiota bacterium]
MRNLISRIISVVRGSDSLAELGSVLCFTADDISRLRRLPRLEAMKSFGRVVAGRHGGRVDWRASPEDIYDLLVPCLSPAERARLPGVETIETSPPLKVLRVLASYLQDTERVLRVIEDGSDSYLVLLVPRERVRTFEWAVRLSDDMKLA